MIMMIVMISFRLAICSFSIHMLVNFVPLFFISTSCISVKLMPVDVFWRMSLIVLVNSWACCNTVSVIWPWSAHKILFQRGIWSVEYADRLFASRWVRDFLSEHHSGLDWLIKYLSYVEQVIRQVMLQTIEWFYIANNLLLQLFDS